ncbi:MAG: NUDIX hydrolase [Gemmatimonadaceae bacterium]
MHPLLTRIEAALRAQPGRTASLDGDPVRAAVALAFREDRGEPELLMIRRSERAGDPWSGHIALPGGRWSPNDESLEATAVRETLEETGLDVRRSGVVLGALDDLRPRTATLPAIVVTPYVAVVDSPPDLHLSDEVADAFWVPWSLLIDPTYDRESEVHVRGATWRVPSFVLREHVVWGMTERILRQLLSRLA